MTRHHDKKDNKAIHGYKPSWDLQRKKQEETAKNFYENRDESDAELKRKYREMRDA